MVARRFYDGWGHLVETRGISAGVTQGPEDVVYLSKLLDTFEYRETIQFMFAEELHTLEFPSPWLKQHPTVYCRSTRGARAADTHVFTAYDESFSRELRHFHDCVVGGIPCRTPPEGARLDIDVLTQMFLAAR